VHYNATGARNIEALFFIPGWDQYRFHKIALENVMIKLVFFYLVGYVGHVVHFVASWV
jgi:hypothetical protein